MRKRGFCSDAFCCYGVATRSTAGWPALFHESPRQTKPKKGPKRKVHEFRSFLCEFWCFSLGKQARFTLNFCSGMPLRKVHELTFFWFGLPGPLLIVCLVAWPHIARYCDTIAALPHTARYFVREVSSSPR